MKNPKKMYLFSLKIIFNEKIRNLEICSFSLIKSEVTVWMGITDKMLVEFFSIWRSKSRAWKYADCIDDFSHAYKFFDMKQPPEVFCKKRCSKKIVDTRATI